MEFSRDRRKAPRIAVAEGMALRAKASYILEVRLLDLSFSGARVAHLDLLRPSAPSVLELPPLVGPLTLAAEIARSQVVGTQLNLFGERLLCYESGLAFLNVTKEQRDDLAGILRWLALTREQQGGRLPRLRLPLEQTVRLAVGGQSRGMARTTFEAAYPDERPAEEQDSPLGKTPQPEAR